MYKNILTILITLLIASYATNSFALPYSKQSLSLVAGAKTLTFEAPRRKCFIDHSSELGEGLYTQVGHTGGQYLEKILLTIIVDCDDLSNTLNVSDTGALTANSIKIYWLNPIIGDVLNITREEYFDLYEKHIREQGFFTERELIRTKNHVFHSSENLIQSDFGSSNSFTTTSSTLIKGIPIEISFKTNDKFIDLDQKEASVENFVRLQIQINE